MKESILYCHKRKATHNKNTVRADHWYGDCEVHPKTTNLYDPGKPIHELKVKEAIGDDFTPYWAWWDNDKEKFTMMYYHRDLLEICFPYGLKAETEHGKGQDYNVTVEELGVIDPKSL